MFENGFVDWMSRNRIGHCSRDEAIAFRNELHARNPEVNTVEEVERNAKAWWSHIREEREKRCQEERKHEEEYTDRQKDLECRLEVERVAIQCVIKRFEKRGYKVRSVETDKVGWDLQASIDG
jgi:hypothetical protein